MTVILSVAFLLAGTLESVPAEAFRQAVEADWLLQEHVRTVRPQAITPDNDAAGACNGVKDGTWGFHTAQEEGPWWQVDLGQSRPISTVVIWNRCDEVAPRASRLRVLLSDDAATWQAVYEHDGTAFFGATDQKPLTVDVAALTAAPATRFVRIQLPGKDFLHLDEVEVFGPDNPQHNLAYRQPAQQSSVSPWSKDNRSPGDVDWAARAERVLDRCRALAHARRAGGIDAQAEERTLRALTANIETTRGNDACQRLYLEARWIQRRLLLADPLLDFDTLFFAKRVPGSYSHMSDQYYGWWSRPGGGLFLLRGFTGDSPAIECISGAFQEPGSFLLPELSHEGDRLLFAWCRHYPGLAENADKLNKDNVPEDAFYHLYEMNLDGTGPRRVTSGKYDDFDGRYLPDGRIVFLSTRRGQAVQCSPRTAAQTLAGTALPDIYVRCGGGPQRPVAVYTLHTMNPDGGGLCPISPFEMFEWTPSIANDGSILYSRWDYVDRDNMPYMGLWNIRPDGSSPRIVYANFSKSPHCTFEPRCVPGTNKIVFTASGHHAQTMGSLVLLDPAVGTEGAAPITRLTPEVPFPEIEGWPKSFYANPWPLSERLYLTAWGCSDTVREGQLLDPDMMGIYVYDAESGQLELLYRDPDISSGWPVPVLPRARPPVVASHVDWQGPLAGKFLMLDVYEGLDGIPRGAVKALRIVAVPAKTHPTMNYPAMGITRDDPGKCVLGTVPVDADGSAHFQVPAGVTVFFQALDERGMAVQTMRSATHVQPAQTLSCIGCHEQRHASPPVARATAAAREPDRITVGPEGSWPLRFDQLIQPVLDAHCVLCHTPEGRNEKAAKFNLRAEAAYESLVGYGSPSLRDYVMSRYRGGYSVPGDGPALTSALLAKLAAPDGHHGVKLDADARERLITWVDTYAQFLGSFSAEQEAQLAALRRENASVLIERPEKTQTSQSTRAGTATARASE